MSVGGSVWLHTLSYGAFLIDVDTSKIVCKIFELAKGGLSKAKIARELNDKNVPTRSLSTEEFQSAQRIGQSRKKQPTDDTSLLVGHIVCSECGRSMIRTTWQRGGKPVVGFQCRTRTIDASVTFSKDYLQGKYRAIPIFDYDEIMGGEMDE